MFAPQGKTHLSITFRYANTVDAQQTYSAIVYTVNRSIRHALLTSERDKAMYSVICKLTGQILANNLTLDGVDKWVARNESKYESIRAVGMTIFCG